MSRMTTLYLPGGRFGKTNTALSRVWPLAPKTPHRNSARAIGALPWVSSTKGGRGMGCAPAKAALLSLTAASIPLKLDARLGIEFWRSPATSPRDAMSKKRCAAFSSAVRVAASKSPAERQLCALLRGVRHRATAAQRVIAIPRTKVLASNHPNLFLQVMICPAFSMGYHTHCTMSGKGFSAEVRLVGAFLFRKPLVVRCYN